jgi:hypothetical protein
MMVPAVGLFVPLIRAVQTMDPAAFIELINTGVSVAILFFFIRGDVVSKRTVETITEKLVAELSARIIEAVNRIMKERDDDLRERLNRIEGCINSLDVDNRRAL